MGIVPLIFSDRFVCLYGCVCTYFGCFQTSYDVYSVHAWEMGININENKSSLDYAMVWSERVCVYMSKQYFHRSFLLCSSVCGLNVRNFLYWNTSTCDFLVNSLCFY